MKTFKELQEQLAEDQYTAEYKIKYYVDPITGENKTRKIRPHRVNFAASKMRGEPAQKDAQGDYGMKEGYVSANSAPDIQPQMNEGKMGQIHADIEDHLGKHLANYKKMGGSEHFGNKTVEAAKKISKAHGIAQHHAQKLVNDYVDSALKESDESWATSMEKQKQDRLTDKDKGTLGKIADMMAKEKAKREFDLKMKKAQNSQRVAKALGEDKKEDLPFTPDKPKKNPVAKPGKYGLGYSIAKHLARQAMKKMTKEELELDEAVDKEHPIYKEYQALRKMPIKDLRDRIKQQHRIVDTSEFRTKEHAASHIINTKHGNKRVKAVFGEETEQIDEDKNGSWVVHKDGEFKGRFATHKGAKAHAEKHGAKVASSEYYADHIAPKKNVKEEVEQIDEISKQLAGKYLDKVTKDQIKTQGMQPNMYDKLPANRQKGVDNAFKRLKEENIDEAYRLPSDSEIDKVKAHVKANHPNKSLAQVAVHKQTKKIEYVVKDKEGKMTGHTLGEEVEQIDEISKATLGSYVKKASHDAALRARFDDRDSPKAPKKAVKRLVGIAKATDKLTKEESDLDEEKRGLWANIHAKRERIKRGSGERMRKPGSKGAPTDAALKAAAEQVEESRGHKILATALGNIERWKNVSFDQPKYTEKGIETPKKDAESKEKKQMVSKEENEKVYDEKWKKYVGKSFKKATE